MPSRCLRVLCLALIILAARPVWATPEARHLAQLDLEDEAPPKPEPPYPTTDQPLRAEISTDDQPPAADDSKTNIERPYKVDEDGNYFYDTKSEKTTPKGQPGIEQPENTHADGAFLYDKHLPPPAFSNRPGVETPESTFPSGEFRYKIQPAKSTHAASFRFGVMSPPKLTNQDNGLTFKDMYGGNPLPVLVGDYEWKRLTTSVGRITIKFNSGLAVASGQGHWKTPRTDPTDVPDERYNFILMPNAVTAHFRFQFWDKQILVPFIEGGPGYYTVAEIRDDGARPNVGGGLVAVGAGGLYILMDWADPRAIRELSSEYGINHVWLTLEAKGALGFVSALDFTSFEGGAGFMMEF